MKVERGKVCECGRGISEINVSESDWNTLYAYMKCHNEPHYYVQLTWVNEDAKECTDFQSQHLLYLLYIRKLVYSSIALSLTQFFKDNWYALNLSEKKWKG